MDVALTGANWLELHDEGFSMKIAIDPWTLASRFRFQGTYVYAQNLIAEFKRLTEGPDNEARSNEAGSNDVRNNVDFCLFAGSPNRQLSASHAA